MVGVGVWVGVGEFDMHTLAPVQQGSGTNLLAAVFVAQEAAVAPPQKSAQLKLLPHAELQERRQQRYGHQNAVFFIVLLIL